jgi:hypothetical protein
MTQLATGHAINGGTRAEQAAADLARQVQLGHLVPGKILRLADFAARRRAPISSLRLLLEPGVAYVVSGLLGVPLLGYIVTSTLVTYAEPRFHENPATTRTLANEVPG